jgi:hypothetical protein
MHVRVRGRASALIGIHTCGRIATHPRWSPQQIAAWLALAYPGDPEMRVSHETIYLSLFVQTRGALRKELFRCLRTGRAHRRPRGLTVNNGQGKIRSRVSIAESLATSSEPPGSRAPSSRVYRPVPQPTSRPVTGRSGSSWQIARTGASSVVRSDS